jgi:drug/metabolite transporter (DMT)-like permease
MSNAILGISLMLFSSALNSIGGVIEKKAVDSLPPMEQQTVGSNVKGVVSNKLWWIGWLGTTSAIILNIIALGQADLTLLQPLQGFGLIVLVIFSHYYLGEKIHKQEIIGILIAIVGTIILGLTANESIEYTTIDSVLKNYSQINAYLCFIILSVLIFGLWIYSVKSGYKGAGVIFALIAAIFSVLGMTFSKGLFTILEMTSFSDTLSLWQSWILLILFLIGSGMALATQQISFQKGKSIVVNTVFNLCTIGLPFITGWMVFNEFISFEKIIALIIILIGSFLLSAKKLETH